MTLTWHDFTVFINGAATGAFLVLLYLFPIYRELRKIVTRLRDQ